MLELILEFEWNQILVQQHLYFKWMLTNPTYSGWKNILCVQIN